MKMILNFVGSMKMMAVLMLIFAVASGYATFIENDYGTMTAQAVVYKARWFELLLIVLAINLMINIVRFNMFQKKKFLILLFHVSFLVILIGAAVTRYYGFEGMMHIREGDSSSLLTSDDTYVKAVFTAKDGKKSQYKTPMLMSKMSHNSFDASVTLENGNEVELELLEYIPNATNSIVADPNGNAIINMMITTGNSGEPVQLKEGAYFETASVVLNFGSNEQFNKPVVDFFVDNDQLYMNHAMNLKYLHMDDQSSGETNASNHSEVTMRTLFTAIGTNFVVRDFFAHAKQVIVPSTTKSGPMMRASNRDGLRFNVTYNGVTKETVVFGQKGIVGDAQHVDFDDMHIDLTYGAEYIKLPFAIQLVNFDLERYPGSNSPASYASDVILKDSEKGITEPFRIYMNHVLDHRGYRFFQSSYDQDEKGTVLSVNNDPGTLPTYIGYLMLTIGIFGSLFMKGRFARLMKMARDASEAQKVVASLLLVLGLINTPSINAAENPLVTEVKKFDKTHAANFGTLVIQDSAGRMKPIDTLSTEIMHKMNRKGTILGLNANQIILGMMTRPEAWREIKLIRTSHKDVNKLLGTGKKEKLAAFSQFFEFPDEMAGYKLTEAVNEAIRKEPGKRDKFDKAVLQVDERLNVAYMVFSGALLRMWAVPNDANNKWLDTMGALQTMQGAESYAIRELAVNYFTAVDTGLATGHWGDADNALVKISEYQRSVGAAVYPAESKIDLEIWYNHADVFERLWPLYFLVGFMLLVLSFVKIIKPRFKLGLFTKASFILLVLFLIAHTIGLAIRWYISGHAPWSNGYESMVYIGWATVLAGFIFSKRSPITLAATSILAGLILFVAHLNWMDPQVTNLVPVLQSYWLSIHVATITASYGFLGLSALLGFITLILFILKSANNERQLSLSIKELNSINEMSLMIGLAMLTVGNFLGGVWANESWGRYWGWDPKETWALVTILVYAVVIHLRFIKALYTPFLYSVISLLSFTTVLMTYFGVNYYLAGMHSYAKG
ncbi:MAG: cytochrome c biogenesis protein CcsA, partial [Sulfurimonadaceae bacterium]